MARMHLTAGAVNKLPLESAGQQLFYDTRLEGFGLRVGTTRKAYFVEKRVDGRTVRHSIGVHGQPGLDGIAITADRARDLAMVKLGELTSGKDLNAEKKAAATERVEAAAGRAAAAMFTLKALCEQYVQHQKAKGKESWQDAENLFKNYVWGDDNHEASAFAQVPARELTIEQAADLISVPWGAGKKRTAAKLRSYLRAAYALAQQARTDSSKPRELKAFCIELNPIAATGALSEANRQRRTALTQAELGEAVRLLEAKLQAGYDDALAAILLSVRLGGQRPAQVLRIAPKDVNTEAWTITIWDRKGRRTEPREHVLPVPRAARPLVETILAHRRGESWVFGDSTARTTPDTLARKGVELLREAQENLAARAGEPPQLRELQPRDLRRTCETQLAAMRVSKDLRGQLQSHGLGGVQDRHYDMHTYLEEKANALAAWNAKLQALAAGKAPSTNVKALKRAA